MVVCSSNVLSPNPIEVYSVLFAQCRLMPIQHKAFRNRFYKHAGYVFLIYIEVPLV